MKKCPNCDYKGSMIKIGDEFGYQCPECNNRFSRKELYGGRE